MPSVGGCVPPRAPQRHVLAHARGLRSVSRFAWLRGGGGVGGGYAERLVLPLGAEAEVQARAYLEGLCARAALDRSQPDVVGAAAVRCRSPTSHSFTHSFSHSLTCSLAPQ